MVSVGNFKKERIPSISGKGAVNLKSSDFIMPLFVCQELKSRRILPNLIRFTLPQRKVNVLKNL